MKERQNWPQVMIDHILNPEPLDYDEMDWASLTAGMTGKILAEMESTATDIVSLGQGSLLLGQVLAVLPG